MKESAGRPPEVSSVGESAAAQSGTNETDGIKLQTRCKTASGYTRLQ
ncbi:MAG: hypothetical protein JSS81_17980 [Acidobacteria bacterium]|nr:hypothetical protein [Acidobacteriota bacterium]